MLSLVQTEYYLQVHVPKDDEVRRLSAFEGFDKNDKGETLVSGAFNELCHGEVENLLRQIFVKSSKMPLSYFDTGVQQ
jgi:hypothetical protein